jgi:hypothetical protein
LLWRTFISLRFGLVMTKVPLPKFSAFHNTFVDVSVSSDKA